MPIVTIEVRARARSMSLSARAVYECVVTTVCKNGRINSAAMGVRVNKRGGNTILKLRIFDGSDTAKNIMRMNKKDKMSVSFVDYSNLDLIVKSALKGHASDESEFEIRDYARSNGIPYLKQGYISAVCSLVEISTKEVTDAIGKVSVHDAEFIVEKWLPGKQCASPKPVTRADCALLEAAVLATRLHGKGAKERKKELKRLLILVEKTGDDAQAILAKFVRARAF